MRKKTLYHYVAFSDVPTKGNPAGIILQADDLTEKEMQAIAKQVGFNECAFVCSSQKADIRLRFFTPGQEMALCGHATIAAIYALKTRGILEGRGDHEAILIETQAGIFPIQINNIEGQIVISMQQAPAQFYPFEGSPDELAAALGLVSDDLDARLPIMYGSTGIWTLLVPIRTLQTFEQMKPDTQRFPSLLQKFPRASIHPFCLKTYDPLALMHGRHFSSPFSGTIEDPVTGTASGVMGAYYVEYIQPGTPQLNVVVEQGFEVKRDGRVKVQVKRVHASIEVTISGTAAYVSKWEVDS